MKPLIISYQTEYKNHFIDLNKAWLEEYFVIEPHDNDVFNNIESYILDPGGMIFFCLVNNEIAGTVAMQKVNETTFELAKLAVDKKFQGLKLSNLLMDACITFAQKKKANKIMLLSNRKLKKALNLYIKYGFTEVPMKENEYDRADIQMEFLV
ncbi:GNAT family N-acetyltransferase [Flavobacterium sp. 9AF]|uniref:GNAT family N-acetyltransferase n=1 Tax=Flavobacterium sp. 9AF TaxID=2653142 RepID=UPI0012F2930B|nr:GNAT family N-acetyltransferase [Flavobacterium sp. 9AF]VXA97264.1 GNAT family N-acetyltransferase [Flavobacterium sp. 9AF]